MTVLEQLNKVLNAYQDTELHRQVLYIVRQYLHNLQDDLESHAAEIYDLEMTQPVARDRETMQRDGEFHYNEFKKRRKERRVLSLLQKRGQSFPLDRAKAEKFVEQTSLGPDPFENEIKMMAVSFIILLMKKTSY
jgi:hypothetical protein